MSIGSVTALCICLPVLVGRLLAVCVHMECLLNYHHAAPHMPTSAACN